MRRTRWLSLALLLFIVQGAALGVTAVIFRTQLAFSPNRFAEETAKWLATSVSALFAFALHQHALRRMTNARAQATALLIRDRVGTSEGAFSRVVHADIALLFSPDKARSREQWAAREALLADAAAVAEAARACQALCIGAGTEEALVNHELFRILSEVFAQAVEAQRAPTLPAWTQFSTTTRKLSALVAARPVAGAGVEGSTTDGS